MTHVLRIKAYFKVTLLPAMFYISSLSNYLTLSLDTFWKALYIIIKRHDFERKKKEKKKKKKKKHDKNLCSSVTCAFSKYMKTYTLVRK